MITARAIAKPLGSEGHGLTFGTDREAVLAMLRDLVAKLEARKILLQGCSVSQKTGVEDFAIQTLSVEFAEAAERLDLGITESCNP
jgi:hypothetical protein